MREELNEDGIVIDSEKGVAEVALLRTDNCEECSAKIFCKPKADNTKILRVSDPFGAKPGDEVRIAVGGDALFKYSLIIYGMPLLLMVLGILSGVSMFSSTSSPELFSFLFGLSITSIYFLIVYFILKNYVGNSFMPKITFVRKR